MKKTFTKLMAITVMLLLGVWNVSAQTPDAVVEGFTTGWTDQTFNGGSYNEIHMFHSGASVSNGTVDCFGANASRFSVRPDANGDYFQLELSGAGVTSNLSKVSFSVTANSAAANTGHYGWSIDGTNWTDGAQFTMPSSAGPCLNVSVNAPANAKYFRIARNSASVTWAGTTGGGQTIRILGVSVWIAAAAPTISAFEIAGVAATIDQTAKTITAELPYGTNVTSLTPIITTGGTATEYSPSGAQDFSNPVSYSVTDGTNNVEYTVTITVATSVSDDATLSDLLVNGTSIVGFSPTTLIYNVELPYGSANPVVTAEKNDAAAANPIITNITSLPGSATVLVTAQAGNSQTYTINFTEAAALKEVTEIIFSNSFNAFIVGETVTAYYMAGEEKPTIQSYKASEDATVAISGDGTKIIVTGADNVTRELDLTLEPVTPFTGTTPLIFDGSESWIKTRNTFDTGKGWVFAKDVEEESNKRVSEGKSRVYFFVGDYDKLTFTSGTSARNVKIFVNGVELASPTATVAAGGTFDIILGGAEKYMVAIFSNKTSGDGGVTALTTTPNVLTSTKNLNKNEFSFDGSTIQNPKNVKLNVFDVTGRLVISSDKNIEMSSDYKGIYIIKSDIGVMKINVR